MLYGIPEARKINAFVEVAIPSLQDLFYRYGERISQGFYGTSNGVSSDPVPASSSSVIQQMIRAQNLLEVHTNSPKDV